MRLGYLVTRYDIETTMHHLGSMLFSKAIHFYLLAFFNIADVQGLKKCPSAK